MEFLIVKLDPDTREELYADIHENLLDFVLLEALTIAGKEMTENKEAVMEAAGDDFYHLNDPELNMDDAVKAVIDVMMEVDRLAGMDVSAETYDTDEQYKFISDKLMLAVASVTAANKVGEILNLYSVISQTKFVPGIHVKGTHLGNIATLSLIPLSKEVA